MTKRIKAPSITTRIKFERLLDEIAASTVELRHCQAARNNAVQRAQTIFQSEIEAHEAAIKAKASLCEKYAKEHRDELLPGKVKSAETPLARYGFRTGMPTLKLLSKFTWEQVVQRLKHLGKRQFIRMVLEPDKQAILTAQTTDDLSDFGVRVVQAETFFIEPKVDGADLVKAGGAP